MNVHTAQLEEVADFINGRAFKPSEWGQSGTPIIRIQNLTGTSEAFNYYDGLIDERIRVRKGDILISWSASLGVYRWNGEDAVLNQHIFKVRLNDGIDPIYFYYAATDAVQEMASRVHGSTMQHITKDRFDSIHIPLPNLSEQQRIARQLEQADRLRRTRRYALELSDSFLPAAFLELFGDPLENPKGYKIDELGELFQIPPGLGTTKPCEPGGNLRCVRVGEVGLGGINLDACGFVNLSESERRRFVVETGDILLARAIGSEDHLGKLSICQPHTEILTFDSHLMRVRVNLSRLLPQFLATLLWSSGGRRLFMRQARRTAVQFNINAEQMSELAIPLPPLAQQQQFAALVARHERLRATQREALRQAEHLFQTLLHRAFSEGLQC